MITENIRLGRSKIGVIMSINLPLKTMLPIITPHSEEDCNLLLLFSFDHCLKVIDEMIGYDNTVARCCG